MMPREAKRREIPASALDYLGRPETLPGSDTLIKHQPFEVETLTSDNVFGTLTRTLDFTWASRCRLRVGKTSGSWVRFDVIWTLNGMDEPIRLVPKADPPAGRVDEASLVWPTFTITILGAFRSREPRALHTGRGFDFEFTAT
jgi:hypothetical protein